MVKGVAYYYRVGKDLWRLLGKQAVVLGMGVALAKMTWDQRELLANYIR
jgi:hypothetical protein